MKSNITKMHGQQNIKITELSVCGRHRAVGALHIGKVYREQRDTVALERRALSPSGAGRFTYWKELRYP